MTTGRTPTRPRATSSAAVAVGMFGMNVGAYLLTIVAARLLMPHAFGALTAILGILLVGTVASLGMQAATARRIAVASTGVAEIIALVTRTTFVVGAAVAAAVSLSTLVLTPALKLGSPWPVVLCGLTLLPLTVFGTQVGIAQGTRQWRRLTVMYLAAGVGRAAAGCTAIAIRPTVTSALIGIAVGAWLPVLAGWRLFSFRAVGTSAHRTALVREALSGSHALLAYFALSNMDALIARNLLSVHDSGLYASGLILAKAALFLPQFVSVVMFPELARIDTAGARLRAVRLVAGFGLLATTATALLPRLALVLAGGDNYAEMTSRLWLFALAGSLLAVVHLLVFDALARKAHGIVFVLWLAVSGVLAAAYGLEVGITGLVTVMAVVAALLATVVYFWPAKRH